MDFSELAQVKGSEVKRPPTVPQGHYLGQFSGPMKQHKAKSGNVAMRFPWKLVGATDDVDAEELDAAGGIPDKEYTFDFWMSPDARYRFTEFCEAQGAPIDQLNLIELASWLIENNKPFSIQAKHRQGDDPGNGQPAPVYVDWDNIAAAE
jgi:hypothetical protein